MSGLAWLYLLWFFLEFLFLCVSIALPSDLYLQTVSVLRFWSWVHSKIQVPRSRIRPILLIESDFILLPVIIRSPSYVQLEVIVHIYMLTPTVPWKSTTTSYRPRRHEDCRIAPFSSNGGTNDLFWFFRGPLAIIFYTRCKDYMLVFYLESLIMNCITTIWLTTGRCSSSRHSTSWAWEGNQKGIFYPEGLRYLLAAARTVGRLFDNQDNKERCEELSESDLKTMKWTWHPIGKRNSSF